MLNKLAHVCIVVRDYDEAIQWYTEKLGLELRSDHPFGNGYRWVTLGVNGGTMKQDTEIVLYQPGPREEDSRMSRLGQVSKWVFGTDNCQRDVEVLRSRGVNVVDGPSELPWGIQAMFEDLYGNTFVMVETKEMKG
ncbi:VOC family protein [Marininema halotolerans]|uniref:Catechol 2,3-dioxygenase n=1 Tax=Marininema halotolerans TaxID=1155944 RepID=A0A1I6PLP1_9BACL|nr:VOC family protein [Marininema halotolerans]SFS41137.1 Catechol 2,3-dioxygenase [Marininema halotolerans]